MVRIEEIFHRFWKKISSLTGTLRSSRPEEFLVKGLLKICSKFTGEQFPCNFIEITLRHGCPPVNLLLISRAPFSTNTSGWLLLNAAGFHFKDWHMSYWFSYRSFEEVGQLKLIECKTLWSISSSEITTKTFLWTYFSVQLKLTVFNL